MTAKAQPLGGLEVEVALPQRRQEAADANGRPRRRIRLPAARTIAGLFVLTAALVVLAYGALGAAGALVRVAETERSDRQARSGRDAFRFVWKGMSEPTLRKVAGTPSWVGTSAGACCLVYGDVDSDSAAEFCFRGGLVSKRLWSRRDWLGIVDAPPAASS